MRIRVLGCSGAIAKGSRTTAFLVDHDLLVDAGTGVGDLSLGEMADIDHVLITHCHLDHIAALPLMLDSVASLRRTPVTVWALPETIAALKQHVFNNTIWPNFAEIPSVDKPFMVFKPLEQGDVLNVAGKTVEVLPAQHTVPAVAYGVAPNRADGKFWVFSGDTGHNPAFWTRLNAMKVSMLIIETAFSEREKRLAEVSEHLCPSRLATELSMLRQDVDFPILITHTKPAETAMIMSEILDINQNREALGLPRYGIGWLSSGQEFEL